MKKKLFSQKMFGYPFQLLNSHKMLNISVNNCSVISESKKVQWLSGRELNLRPKGRRFEPHRRHCIVSLSKNINPSLVLVQPKKTCPFKLLKDC